MTDIKKLRECIDSAGIKYSFIAEKLGLSRQAFSNALARDNTDFKTGQMFIISDILGLSPDQQREIFFAHEVD